MKHKKKIILISIIILTLVSFCGIITYNHHFVDISNYTYETNNEQATIDDLPSSLKNALIAVEDSRFYTHNGIDYIAIARTTPMNIIEKDVGQGASTITQQLARTLFLPDISTEHTKKDSIDRKIKEIIIAKHTGKYNANIIDDGILYKRCVADGGYQQTKGVCSEKRIPSAKIQGFRKFDKVRYRGETYFIKGRMSSGYARLMYINNNEIDFSAAPKGMKTPKLNYSHLR